VFSSEKAPPKEKMPRFAANLSMLFTEVPFLDRFEQAAKAGFEAVEFWFPYEFEAREIRRRLDDNGLTLALHNLHPGDADKGDRGIACNPARKDEFRASVALGITYAHALGAGQLNCLAGKAPAGFSSDALRACFVDNLRYAANAFKAEGLRLLIEPINHFDVPGFYLNYTAQAAEIIAAVDADNLFIQYDMYHAQRMEGELATTVQKYLPKIGHIQIADNPGRNEPGSGEINFSFLFAHLDRINYKGWIGCEYNPATSTTDGLNWRDRLTT
jgi:hydroxypyruvate isomerase